MKNKSLFLFFFLREFLILHENACNMIRLEPGRAAAVLAQSLKVVDVECIQAVFAVSPRYCASLPQDYIESTIKFDALVKSPDAALRCILSHCGVQQVRLMPSDLRALPAAFLRARPEIRLLGTFYDSIKFVPVL